ncbi:hypothetical protein CKO19_10535 [Rhodovulum adriaticum]|nr:hypothetical protein [Rhodovulum adriaticum]
MICDTPWGYIIRSDTPFSDRAVLIERVSGLAGLSFLFVAGGQWFLEPLQAAATAVAPGLHEKVTSEMLLSVAMAIAGILFLWISVRGVRQEVQVDLEARCLAWANCNHCGKSRLNRSIPFDRIGSIFIRRSKSPGVPAILYARLEGCETPIEVARGREAALTPVHQRLCTDLNVHRSQSEAGQVRPVRPRTAPAVRVA